MRKGAARRFALHSVDDLDVAGRRVFVRSDLNVPIKKGRIVDPGRIDGAMDTIRWLVERDARVIIASHLGRPKGKPTPEYSLAPVAEYLQKPLGRSVVMAKDSVGEAVANQAAGIADGEVLILENLRFHPGEEANDPDFARALADHAELYVNDAFGTAHRSHASTTGMVRFFGEGKRAIGFLMKRELDYLSPLLSFPKRPFIVILGGAKVSDKVGVMKNLLRRVDALLIGGAMAYTFLAAEGVAVGASRIEKDKLDVARELLATARRNDVRIELPIDHVATKEIAEDASGETVDTVPPGLMGVDIGPETIRRFSEEIQRAKTIFWNGPVGVFEIPPFSKGTFAIAEALASSNAMTVIGGGDSAAAAVESGHADAITHISTGGGASLEFLEGQGLPALEALENE